MEEIYANVDYDKPVNPRPSTNQTGPRSSERRLHGAVILCLGLLSVFLLAGLISLAVHYRASVRDSAAELSTINANLTERLQATNDKLSSVSEERDLLNASITNMTKELNRLQSLSKQNRASVRDSAAELSTINANLTERLQATNDKLSSVSEERDLLNASITNMTKELNRLQSLSKQNRVSVRDSAAELFTINANLTERLQATNDKLSSVSEERDLLNASITNMTKELNRLQSLSKQKKTCPAGWTRFSCSCYLVSTKSDSWEKGRQDCRDRGADLVIIDSYEEQEFLHKIIKNETWIGLNDRENEGTWKWTDETPLTVTYWCERQPDNGGGDPRWGEEDCGEFLTGMNIKASWNDLRCDDSLQWICEKVA